MSELVERNKVRWQVLKRIYDGANGTTVRGAAVADIARDAGLGLPAVQSAVEYFVEEGLLERMGSLTVNLTEYGIKEVKEFEANPTRGSDHFVPIREP